MNELLHRRWNQVKELASILPRPSTWRALVTWKPFSITAFKMARALEVLVPNLETIIDVGANEGQFSRAMTETYPTASVIAFEPLPEVGKRLEDNLNDAGRIHIDRRAVGASDGTLSFNRYEYSLQSSVLHRLQDRSVGPSRNDAGVTIDVPVTRLDSALSPDDLHPPTLLKLDVQGYELEVLAGATDLLSQIEYILVEAGFQQTYKNQPLFDEIYNYLTDHGYRILAPVDVLEDADGVIIQADILFQRS